MRTGQATVRIQNEQSLFKKNTCSYLVTFFNKRHYEVRFHRIVKINSQKERKNQCSGEGKFDKTTMTQIACFISILVKLDKNPQIS